MRVSILIPNYNEAGTISELLDRVFAVDFGEHTIEVIVIDDCSTDESAAILTKTVHPVQLLKHEMNRGKSAAIRTGLTKATGDYVIIQDADLELDPTDITKIIAHAESNQAAVVYGSRYLKATPTRKFLNGFQLGSMVVTKAVTVLYLARITDEPTCYKFVRRDVLNSLQLTEERFGFCPEVTAKLLRLRHKIHEVPISYYPRNLTEGKKIRYRDGVHALYILLKYRVQPVSHWLQSKEAD